MAAAVAAAGGTTAATHDSAMAIGTEKGTATATATAGTTAETTGGGAGARPQSADGTNQRTTTAAAEEETAVEMLPTETEVCGRSLERRRPPEHAKQAAG